MSGIILPSRPRDIRCRDASLGADLIYEGTDAFGLLQGVLQHLAQVIPFVLALADPVTVSLEFFHVDQERRERAVQLVGDGLAGVFLRAITPSAGRLVAFAEPNAAVAPLPETGIGGSVSMLCHRYDLTATTLSAG